LLQAAAKWAGHQNEVDGFCAALRQGGCASPADWVVRYPSSVAGVCETLDGLWRGNRRPTAVIMSQVRDGITAFTHLQRRGIQIPADLSFVVLFGDVYVQHLVPAVTHYRINYQTHVRRLMAKLLAVMVNGLVTSQPVYLMPQFVPGETVAAPPV
jgi:DNA-binding LacI/PurR family transcriptional regulator